MPGSSPTKETTQYPPGLVSRPTESITLTSCSTCGTRSGRKGSCSKVCCHSTLHSKYCKHILIKLSRRGGCCCSEANPEKLELSTATRPRLGQPVERKIASSQQKWYFNISGYQSAMDGRPEIYQRLKVWSELEGEEECCSENNKHQLNQR